MDSLTRRHTERPTQIVGCLDRDATIKNGNGLSPAETFVVLAHEYAHCLLHFACDQPASRDTRELEAEAVAFVIAEAVGLDARESTRDYLHLYNGDREALVASLDRIQRTASVILAAISAGGRR